MCSADAEVTAWRVTHVIWPGITLIGFGYEHIISFQIWTFIIDIFIHLHAKQVFPSPTCNTLKVAQFCRKTADLATRVSENNGLLTPLRDWRHGEKKTVDVKNVIEKLAWSFWCLSLKWHQKSLRITLNMFSFYSSPLLAPKNLTLWNKKCDWDLKVASFQRRWPTSVRLS